MSNGDTISSAEDIAPSEPKIRTGLQWLLAAVSICILISVVTIMTWALHWQFQMLDAVSHGMLSRPSEPDSSFLMYVGMANFAVLKTCALAFAFVLIFVGSVYVLWPGQSPFKVSADSPKLKTTLESSSPGLIMIALGVGLTALIVFYKANLSMSETGYGSAQPIVVTNPQAIDSSDSDSRTDLKNAK
jgi:hypothetical protein